MTKRLLVFVAVLGLLSFLNPTEARHRERFAGDFRVDHPVLSLLGADRVAPSLLTYRSYGMVSVGRVGERVAMLGGLGMVHVRELDLQRLGDEAEAQGRGAVKGYLDGLREGAPAGIRRARPGDRRAQFRNFLQAPGAIILRC